MVLFLGTSGRLNYGGTRSLLPGPQRRAGVRAEPLQRFFFFFFFGSACVFSGTPSESLQLNIYFPKTTAGYHRSRSPDATSGGGMSGVRPCPRRPQRAPGDLGAGPRFMAALSPVGIVLFD